MATRQPLKQSGSPDVPHRMDLLDRPGLNKGTAFTEEQRSKFGLHGLLLHVGVADAALKSAPVDVTLIDRCIYHLFQPVLYQVATGSLSPGEIDAPLRSVLSRHKNTRVSLGEVVDLDPLSKRVLLAHGASFEYESLIVSAGSQTFHYGYDAWREWAPGMKSLEEATNIRHKILYAFAAQRRVSQRQGRSGRSRTPLGRYRQEPHAVPQLLLLGRLFPRQRDRTRPRLSRLRNGRPVVRGEFDVLMRVAAHRSHNLTDAIESLPSGLNRPKHKEHHVILSDAA
jgi:hypothetical protein